jgi:2-succinyl-5-enolpyruvyl-6-hydroxy-3-cyclohexene-1-carboxylate synthase
MPMNIDWSRKLIAELCREGVREIVYCAGARNSPLVSVLDQFTGLKLYSFFEERSATFFALGLARGLNRPVVVITTSGTAAAELLPATIEAFHVGVPLILMTADRPRRLRGTGAPQSIDQIGLYGKFVDKKFDLERGEMFSLVGWNRRLPAHINICFDEPLIDGPLQAPPIPLSLLEVPAGFAGQSSFGETLTAQHAADRVLRFLERPGPLLTIVGSLETSAERVAVSEFLVELGAPVYLECTSGLRECSSLNKIALSSGDKILAWGLKHGLLGRVLRIGGVPTARIWRDLEEPASLVDVLSLSSLPFAGLSRGELVCSEIAPTAQLLSKKLNLRPKPDAKELIARAQLFEKDQENSAKLFALHQAEPQAEPSLVHQLSQLMATGSMVYIGNSLPIREWDLSASRQPSQNFAVQANRGVNGIDGQLSTFLGLASHAKENWCLIGDLTALYDLTGPWALQFHPESKIRIIVLNNGGGKIFSRIFGNPLFENRHQIGFAAWAKMWNLSYEQWHEVPEPAAFADTANRVQIIELIPNAAASERFWQAYDSWWS